LQEDPGFSETRKEYTGSIADADGKFIRRLLSL
jgi:hypothetical protein